MRAKLTAVAVAKAATTCISRIDELRAKIDRETREGYRKWRFLWWGGTRTDAEVERRAQCSVIYPSQRAAMQRERANDLLALALHYAPETEMEVSGEHLEAVMSYLPSQKSGATA